MYSRYTPNERGGFDRHEIPAPTARNAALQEAVRSEPDPVPVSFSSIGTGNQAYFPGASPQQENPSRRSDRLSRQPRRPAAAPGLLSGLFRSVGTDDLLILTILVLVLKQDGADRATIAIAVGLYFLLGSAVI